MAAKFECKKCERKFIDWGAKKLDFVCPECEEELVQISSKSTTKAKKKPALRRVKKVEARVVTVPVELEGENGGTAGPADESPVPSATGAAAVVEKE